MLESKFQYMQIKRASHVYYGPIIARQFSVYQALGDYKETFSLLLKTQQVCGKLHKWLNVSKS